MISGCTCGFETQKNMAQFYVDVKNNKQQQQNPTSTIMTKADRQKNICFTNVM